MVVKIFFCYAHEDELLLNKLKMHLKPLQRQGLIDIWYDRDITPGITWEQEISKQLDEAQIILLLVSPDFMNSDYCYGIEMKRAMERHERREAQVIPIIVRHVYWQDTFGKLQVLPTDAKPVIDRHWHSIDEAFLDIVEGIRKVIQKIAVSNPVAVISQQNPQASNVVKASTSVEQKPTDYDKQIMDRNRFDLFTRQARTVLSLAQEEAQGFYHNYLGTEHLLLGLIREGDGVAAKALANLNINLNKARSAVEFIIGRGNSPVLGEIRLSPRAKKVIELAVDESLHMHHHYIGTEHLLLGIIREGEGIAVGVLESLGINMEKLRLETIKVLN